MKKLILFFALASVYISLSAEEITSGVKDTTFVYEDKIIAVSGSGDSIKTGIYSVTLEGDTVPFKKKDTKSNIVYNGSSYNFIFSWNKKKHFDPHWDGLGMAFIGLDGLEGADLKMSTSYSIMLNLMNYYVPLDRSHWVLFTGAGIDWSRYHFKGDMGLTEIDGMTQFQPARPEIHYNSSKLLAYYLTIPLMLEYQQTAGKNDFFISGGVVGYIKCYSKSQVEYKFEGKTIQENKGRDLNILPVNARLMLQVGFGPICLFGYYSPISLFEKEKGPEVYPFGIGLRFTGD